MRLVSVDLAVNDPANGSFEGKCEAAEIAGLLKVEGEAVDVEYLDSAGEIVVDGMQFSIRGRREWVGNWCWDQVLMTVAEAARLAEQLRKNHWTCLEGQVGLFSAFEDARPIEQILLRVLERQDSLSING